MRVVTWNNGRKVIRKITADEISEIRGPSVSPAQMRIALHRMGELVNVQAIADGDPEASIVWEYATEINRSSPLIDALSVGHYTALQIDAMFAAAEKVQL